ncbi:hypothetical protein R9C00_09625 [Flammeovirgaceae bacterium SG7u.111]|nr:hypothetical protein [Flammeovirgaceae bacterium SG7u.132]WPO37709.1 hypothetical protein R9C00_09625 [Flammeovirgaceae bacterium SG7u.111]
MLKNIKIKQVLVGALLLSIVAGCMQKEFDNINILTDVQGDFAFGAEGETIPADTILSVYGDTILEDTNFFVDTLNISRDDVNQILSDEIILTVESGSANLRFLQGVEVYLLDADDLENEILIGFQDTIISTVGSSFELELEPNDVKDIMFLSENVGIRTLFDLRSSVSTEIKTRVNIKLRVAGELE